MNQTLSKGGRFCGDFTVARIEMPSLPEFDRDYASIGKPMILTDLLRKTKAAKRWTPDYLVRTVGTQEITLTRLRQRKLRSNNALYTVPFSEYATRAFANDPEAGQFCAQQIELPDAIAGDFPTPNLVGSWLRVSPRLWLSTPGHVTETHRDANHNLLAQVIGTKKLTLFSPVFAGSLYPHAARGPLARYSRVDMDRPNLHRFPGARELVPTEVTLHAGEALFLPVHWWHRVETREVSVSVNFWWAAPLHLSLHPGLPRSVAPQALFEAVHALADLSSFATEFDVALYLWSEGFRQFSAAYLCHCLSILIAAKSRNGVDAHSRRGLIAAAKGLTDSGALAGDDFQTIRSIVRGCGGTDGGKAGSRRPAAAGPADIRPLVNQARLLTVKLKCAEHFRPSRWVSGRPFKS